MTLWKRFFLVLVLLAMIGGGYRALPAAGLSFDSLSLPFSVGAGSMREMAFGLATDQQWHQAVAAGRLQALGNPAVRNHLLRQALAERRSMVADPSISPELLDLELTVLEHAAGTAPHDRRLEKLLLVLLERAANDPELRPLLQKTLEAALQGSNATAPSP